MISKYGIDKLRVIERGQPWRIDRCQYISLFLITATGDKMKISPGAVRGNVVNNA